MFIKFVLQRGEAYIILNKNGIFLLKVCEKPLFGYVNVYRDELKIKDYNCFRAYYCGLCRELGAQFGQVSRLSLTYDFTFLALLLDALGLQEPRVEQARCAKHLGRKRPVVCENKALSYSAYMSVMLTYFKLRDDLADDRAVGAFFGMFPYRMAVRKAKKYYGEKYRAFDAHLNALTAAEKAGESCVDAVAHHFASLMAEIFDLGDDNLTRLGYNIGRFIYILDAYDDREEDRKKNRYNPILLQYNEMSEEECREAVERSLSITLAETARCYEALHIRRNKAVLDNIIYIGLRAQMEKICASTSKQEGKTQDESI